MVRDIPGEEWGISPDRWQTFDPPRVPDDPSPYLPTPTRGPTPSDPGPAPAPPRDPLAGYSPEQQDFLRRNQNANGSYDFHRLGTAFQSTSDRNYDSQNPSYRPPSSPAPAANFNTGLASAYHGVFNDPLTKQYEQILQQQLAAQQQQQEYLRNAFNPLIANQQQLLQQQQSAYEAQQRQLEGVFNPLIQNQQQLFQQQRAQYEAQQRQLEEAARQAELRRGSTGQAADRLTQFINQRVAGLQQPDPAAAEVERLLGFLGQRATKLQGPAYTGTEQEVLRTQLLDPIERDRQAARKRALQTISSRGYELDSGVAQQLLLEVDRAFNEQRTSAQGALSQRQIEEQRSREQEAQTILDYLPQVKRGQAEQQRGREQEAQQLLQYLSGMPDAIARGDLEYVTYVQSLLNQPRQASAAAGMAGGTSIAQLQNLLNQPRQAALLSNVAGGTSVAQLMDLMNRPGTQAMSTGQILADLPTKRLNDALATLGMSPSMSGAGSNSIQLLQQLQNQRNMQQGQWADYFGRIGQSFQP